MIKGKLKSILIISGIITISVIMLVFIFGDIFINPKPYPPGSADLDPLSRGVISLTVPEEPYVYSGRGEFNPLEGATATDADGTEITSAIKYSIKNNGSYTDKEIEYSVTGKGLKTAKATRPLHLTNYRGPTITLVRDRIQCDISRISTIGDLIFNNSYVIADDGFGNDISEAITVDNDNDIVRSGTYIMKVSVENFLKDKVTSNITVDVIGVLHDNPIVLAAENVTIKLGEQIEPSSYILSANDPEYGDLTEYIRFTTNLNPNKPGEYYMNFYIADFDGVTTAPVTMYITVMGELID